MHSPRQSARFSKLHRYAQVGLALVGVSSQLTVAALAAAPQPNAVASGTPASTACTTASDAAVGSQPRCLAPNPAMDAHLAVPAGAAECPASGPGAACGGFDTSAQLQPGASSTPDGATACPVPSGKSGPQTPASCSETVLFPQPPIAAASRGASAGPVVAPSVPITSLEATGAPQHLNLSVNAATVNTGQAAELTATSSSSVTGTTGAIEIFDQSAGNVVAACMEASQCSVGYTAASGVHTFAAFVTPPTSQMPVQGATLESNRVDVSWLGVTLASSSTIVAPGKPVTLTARSTMDVGKAGRSIVIYDNTTRTRLTFCSRGTTCTTTLTESSSGVHQILGWIPGTPEAVSQGISLTWLQVSLDASTTYPQIGGTVYLTATTNVDLAATPWSLGIYDQQGRLVDQPCKTGTTCTASVTLSNGATPWFSAAIGAVPPMTTSSALGQLLRKVGVPSSLVGIQARSSSIQPARLLWGVDSCKAFTSTPTGADGLFPAVVSHYGTPDFWGRYLTNTVCPGISPAEVAAAAYNHMGILPIYNDYDCSAVSGYATGRGYADAATAAAASLGIPKGRAIAIDIEPPGSACPGAVNVDGGFIGGWFDGVYEAGYVPTYYGNGTSGSEFAAAWCAAAAAQSALPADSYLWSFEPSLLGSYSRASAPNYAPEQTGCAGTVAAWQYELSAGSNPDVDTDEALSNLPLWYPTSTP